MEQNVCPVVRSRIQSVELRIRKRTAKVDTGDLGSKIDSDAPHGDTVLAAR